MCLMGDIMNGALQFLYSLYYDESLQDGGTMSHWNQTCASLHHNLKDIN